ncbi:MAG: rRNA maturation RNase YbeY [Thermoanaerobaculales bacterium]|nr:rRNA maturation RNase YbeY [Thermoanaerobaculales bacterium]
MTRMLFSWDRRPAVGVAGPLRELADKVFERLDVDRAEVHVLITDDARIRALNRQFRDRDEATDVLSFPDGTDLPSGTRLMGQIVISLDTARIQAKSMGHSELRELQELTLHGLIHLCGYDHTADDGDMDVLELNLRREILQ